MNFAEKHLFCLKIRNKLNIAQILETEGHLNHSFNSEFKDPLVFYREIRLYVRHTSIVPLIESNAINLRETYSLAAANN
jgi:hypothetical protein